MTVMESSQLNQQQQQLINKIDPMKLNKNEEINNRSVDEIANGELNSSRKNSATGSITTGMIDPHPNQISTLSLTSTSSGGSSINGGTANTKLDQLQRNSKASTSKHSSTATPPLNLTSRRSSNNSITIRITNSDHANLDDELERFDENDELESNDRDEAEDTTSNSTNNEINHQPKKKLKERKKLVRSVAQQQHHLNYQESEDLLDGGMDGAENNENQLDSMANGPDEEYTSQNMNSAFDELFAAAQTGNIAKSAMIEAKMAAQAAFENEESGETRRKNSIVRSRHNSFRLNNGSGGGSFKIKSSNNNINNEYEPATARKVMNNNMLTIDNYLGSPNQLTRSQSCKRPGSFKKIRSRNASPNYQLTDSPPNPSLQIGTPSLSRRNSPAISQRSTAGGRRGTQCSITIMNDLENGMQQNRAGSLQNGSLPFDQINGDSEIMNAEVYRVRQFNTTNNGSVINRGDSFKRSFKRSNISIAASNSNLNNSNGKKDYSTSNYHDTNTLNLPDFQEGGFLTTKLSQNPTINNDIDETCFNGFHQTTVNLNENLVDNNFSQVNEINTQDSVEPFLVYVLGATSVGKNSLIKQFYTSEYRGTYEINQTDDDEEEGVSIMLDGVESRIQFIRFDIDQVKQVPNLYKTDRDNDAFILVYSISDKLSFQIVIELLKYIMVNERKTQPIIIAGNKSDLVRKRSISREEGRCLAIKYGCKFVETSVAINDKVDDLLAGILKQIRLTSNNTQDLDNATVLTNNTIINNNNDNKICNKNEFGIDLYELEEKTKQPATNRHFSFKKSTFIRYLQRQRSFKEELEKRNIGMKPMGKSKASSTNSKTNTLSNKSTLNSSNTNSNATNSSFSFLQKLLKLFKKKPQNQSNCQSVENLFSPSLQITRLKRTENK